MAEDVDLTKIYTSLKDGATPLVATPLGTLIDATIYSPKSCVTLCVIDRYYTTVVQKTINPYVSFSPSSGAIYFYLDNIALTYPYTLLFKKIS